MKEHTQLSKFYFPIKTEDPNRHKKYIKQQRLKELAATKNVDVIAILVKIKIVWQG